MPKFALLVLTQFILQSALGQLKPPLAYADEFNEKFNVFADVRLFDLQEIKFRKIDTAYVIIHPPSWVDEDKNNKPCPCSYNDTSARYVFDQEGRIREIALYNGPISVSIRGYDSLGRLTRISSAMLNTPNLIFHTHHINPDAPADTAKYRELVHSEKRGRDSLVTIAALVKFKHGMDTAFVENLRYNARGQLVEKQSAVNKRNAYEFDDDVNAYRYHYLYGYDTVGRLVFYKDFSLREYKKISYPFYGKLTEIYDAATNELKERILYTVHESKGIITIISNQSMTVLTPLEKGSKLFKLKTLFGPSDQPYPFYQEIVYKYRAK